MTEGQRKSNPLRRQAAGLRIGFPVEDKPTTRETAVKINVISLACRSRRLFSKLVTALSNAPIRRCASPLSTARTKLAASSGLPEKCSAPDFLSCDIIIFLHKTETRERLDCVNARLRGYCFPFTSPSTTPGSAKVVMSPIWSVWFSAIRFIVLTSCAVFHQARTVSVKGIGSRTTSFLEQFIEDVVSIGVPGF